MNKSVKKYLLISALFLINTQSIQPNQSNDNSFWCALFGWCYNNTPKQQPTQTKNDDEAPEGVTIDDYIAQLRYDLNGAYYHNRKPVIPWSEVDEIEKAARAELRHTNLHNQDRVNQKIGSILISHVENKTDAILSAFERQGHHISSANKQAIKKSMGSNIAARLENIPHINGEALAQFFGQELAETIKQHLENPTYNNTAHNYYRPTQPTPSAPPVDYYQPHSTTPIQRHTQKPTTIYNQQQNAHQKRAEQNTQALKNALTGSKLKQNDIQKLQEYISNSSLNPYLQSADFLAHAKNSFAQLLDEQLEEQKNALLVDIIDRNKLSESIETTRAQKLAEIEQWLTINNTKIDSLFADNNLQEIILENMSSISCPVCCEFFKQEHRHGQVERVLLKSANHTQSCGHAVCSTCAPQCQNKCPLCRATIDQQDLHQKLTNTFAPIH